MNEFRFICDFVSCFSINFRENINELASDEWLMDAEHRSVSFLNTARMIENDNFCIKCETLSRLILPNISTNCSLGNIHNILQIRYTEANVFSWRCSLHSYILNLNRLNFEFILPRSQKRSKTYISLGFKYTRLDFSCCDDTNTSRTEHIRDGDTQLTQIISWRYLKSIQCFQKWGAFIPRKVFGTFRKVISESCGYWDKFDILDIESDSLHGVSYFFLDLFKSVLRTIWITFIHLVYAHYELCFQILDLYYHSQYRGKDSTCLTPKEYKRRIQSFVRDILSNYFS